MGDVLVWVGSAAVVVAIWLVVRRFGSAPREDVDPNLVVEQERSAGRYMGGGGGFGV